MKQMDAAAEEDHVQNCSCQDSLNQSNIYKQSSIKFTNHVQPHLNLTRLLLLSFVNSNNLNYNLVEYNYEIIVFQEVVQSVGDHVS
jgi:hypothetical protein